MEQEIQKNIQEITKNVAMLAKHGSSFWRSFVNGIFSGFGYMVGIAIAIAIAGYALNVLGIIPAFKAEVEQWRVLMQQAQQIKSSPLHK